MRTAVRFCPTCREVRTFVWWPFTPKNKYHCEVCRTALIVEEGKP